MFVLLSLPTATGVASATTGNPPDLVSSIGSSEDRVADKLFVLMQATGVIVQDAREALDYATDTGLSVADAVALLQSNPGYADLRRFSGFACGQIGAGLSTGQR